MLFNSLTFIVFFAVVLGLHSLPGLSWRTKKSLLLLESYLFYAAWNPPFVVLLWISTAVDWKVAQRIEAAATPGGRRAWMLASVVVNLGILGYFKYGEFLLANWVAAMAALGVDWQAPAWNIILPVGISFYTFQSVSYTVEVYRGRIGPTRNFGQFLAYVAFFPQLVAGPIERASHLLPQLAGKLTITLPMMESGLWLFVWGLFKKVVLADSLGHLVDPVYSFIEPEATQTIVATMAFALQIYCDFSGYTDMARGMARILGFNLMLNFNLPYFATSVQDFWRRWHISLSTWLRDYLYVPLGGNRLGTGRTYLNLMIVMLLGGLWHGAAWNFVAWGLWQGVGLVVNRWWHETVTPRWVMPSWTGWLLTILFTLYGWLLFRSSSADQVLQLTGSLGNWAPEFWVPLQIRELLLLASPLLAMQIWQWRCNDPEAAMRLPGWARGIVQAVLIYLIILFWENDAPSSFIYFQF